MARAPLFGDVRGNPFAVVADAQLQQPIVEGDFRFDMACTGVGEGIPQRLASDAVDFIPNDRIQLSSDLLQRDERLCHFGWRVRLPARVQPAPDHS